MFKLKYDEAKKRVQDAHAELVDELYQSGETLFRDAVDRAAKADGKAIAMAAYSGGIVTLTISTVSLWGPKVSGLFELSAVLGIVAFLIAAWLAIRSTFPVNTEWHSDDDWLRSECLGNLEQMKRYRVLATWKIVDSIEQAYERKQQQIRRALLTIQGAFVLLLISFLQIAWRVTALNGLGVGVRNCLPATLAARLIWLGGLIVIGHI
jgi:hypothetical protein